MKEILNYELLEIGKDVISLSSILKLIGFILLVIIVLKLVKRTIYKANKIDEPKKYSIYSLSKYFILIFAFLTGLQIIGFNLSVLVAGSAALLVGVGLGLQNLFSDFISGIIILFDSTVKVNDVIEINGMVCSVEEINLRTTTVLTRDDKYIILPNTDLTKNQLINWTHNNISSRFEVQVGVDYSSDINTVINLLNQVVITQDGIQKEPKHFVRFIDFGDSALQFSLIFWSEEVFRVRNIESELRIKIFNVFKENNIIIPFPQRVIHINNSEIK
jgi:small-conductance mechanosensitive channel